MILTLVSALIAQADGGGWLLILRDPQQTHYVDRRSVRAIGDRRLLRQRVDFSTARPNGTVRAEYQVEIRCVGRTIALLGALELNRAGEVVQSRKYSSPTSFSISPNSVADRYSDLVCEW